MLQALSKVVTVTLSPLFDTVSGKIGQAHFAEVNGQTYFRGPWVQPVPVSPAQVAVQAAYGAMAGLYQSMIPDFADTWQELADVERLTRFNMFLKYGFGLEMASDPPIMCPPISAIPTPEDLLVVRGGTPGTARLNWTRPGLGAGYFVYYGFRFLPGSEYISHIAGSKPADDGWWQITPGNPGTPFQISMGFFHLPTMLLGGSAQGSAVTGS